MSCWKSVVCLECSDVHLENEIGSDNEKDSFIPEADEVQQSQVTD